MLASFIRADAQNDLKRFYRNEKGITYTSNQFDSLKKVGHPYSIDFIKKITSGDSTIVLFEKKSGLLDNTFIEKYTDKLLPSFRLYDVNGKLVTSNDLKGKIVHINFWSVTCGPCIAEMPELNKLKKFYKGADVIFLAIAPEGNERIINFMKKHQFDYTIISSEAYFNELGVDSYPVNFFVDRNGIIRKVTTGTPYFRNDVKNEFSIAVYRNYSKVINEL